LTEQNAEAFDADIQSLETTVRRNNPTASEEWIQEEMERIESEESTSDSFSLMRGRQNLEQMMGNRDENNEPINDDNIDDEEMEYSFSMVLSPVKYQRKKHNLME